MQWVVLGGGALGTILAAHLTRAGHGVQVVARGARADALEREGLRVRGLVTLDERCEIIRRPEALRTADVFVNTVKTYDSAAALASVAGLRPASAFSVQNGVVKDDELTAAFGAACVIGAMADFSGEVLDDGVVTFSRNVGLHLGELPSGPSVRVQTIARVIDEAGIVTRAVDDVRSIIWSKFSGWVGLMLLAVLSRRSTGDYLQDPDAARVMVRLTRETAALAVAKGVRLIDISPMPVASLIAGTEDAAVEVVRQVGVEMASRAPGHRLSALQDVQRGRRVELEETVGVACRTAASLGLDVSVLRTCYHLAAAATRVVA